MKFDVAVVVGHGAGVVPDAQFQGGLGDCRRRGGGGCGQQREEDGEDGELHCGVCGGRMGRWWKSNVDVGVKSERYIYVIIFSLSRMSSTAGWYLHAVTLVTSTIRRIPHGLSNNNPSRQSHQSHACRTRVAPATGLPTSVCIFFFVSRTRWSAVSR